MATVDGGAEEQREQQRSREDRLDEHERARTERDRLEHVAADVGAHADQPARPAREFRDEPDPVANPDEVIVKVEAVGICGSDMHAYHGHDSRRPPPIILGHEAAGRIVTGPRSGERVTINPLIVDATCPYAIEGRWHLSPTRQILSMPPRPGAFAQYVRVPESNVERIPDSLPIEHAALAEPIAVSWHAVRLGMEKLALPLAAARIVVLGGA